MILNPFLEALIALLLGAGFVVVSHVYNVPELGPTGTLLMGAAGGYVLRELGNGHSNGKTP